MCSYHSTYVECPKVLHMLTAGSDTALRLGTTFRAFSLAVCMQMSALHSCTGLLGRIGS